MTQFGSGLDRPGRSPPGNLDVTTRRLSASAPYAVEEQGGQPLRKIRFWLGAMGRAEQQRSGHGVQEQIDVRVRSDLSVCDGRRQEFRPLAPKPGSTDEPPLTARVSPFAGLDR
jgi:hypothetical protein